MVRATPQFQGMMGILGIHRRRHHTLQQDRRLGKCHDRTCLRGRYVDDLGNVTIVLVYVDVDIRFDNGTDTVGKKTVTMFWKFDLWSQ